ncbi:MAG: hypothetical protein OEW99_13245 [Gammaproteobacteria bacterium]|nr:hypothetical protein [Gammaproteobacteria bacterium]MDH5659350.1 hypothetical protein [Gammaproteobacteria bacterium]
MNKSISAFFKFRMIIASIILGLSLVGCTTKPKPPFEIISPEMGMIYGNIHIPGHEVTEIELREFGKFYMPPFIEPPRVMIFRNGNFVAENLSPGSYYISRFVSKKLNYTLVKDGRSAYQSIINVEPGSVKYVGAFEITNVTSGIFVQGDFNIRTVRKPSERKVLKHLYQVTQGTGWQTRIERRIKSLR